MPIRVPLAELYIFFGGVARGRGKKVNIKLELELDP